MGNEPTGGPLRGVRVVEFNGLGPDPHCGMLLSDLGAEVLRIERRGGNGWPNPIVDRGRHVLELDVRAETGKEQAHRAIAAADVLIEGSGRASWNVWASAPICLSRGNRA